MGFNKFGGKLALKSISSFLTNEKISVSNAFSASSQQPINEIYCKIESVI